METLTLDFGEVSQEEYTAMYIMLKAFLLDTDLDIEDLEDSVEPSDMQDLEDLKVIRKAGEMFLNKMEQEMPPLVLLQLQAAIEGIIIAI